MDVLKQKNICTFHKTEYLDKYFHINGKSCSDPCRCHTKPVKKSLREISLTLSTSNPNLKLIPGRALCTKCLNKIQKPQDDTESEPECQDIFEPQCVIVESVDKACSALGISPVKVQKLSSSAKNQFKKIKL